jgi:D-alanyl-lipoteichoic acid acyltransferase DltB (MBOAT superfamily)
MLFNSYTFIFAFLPVTLLGFAILVAKAPRRLALIWLVAASVFFYGWSRPENLWVLGFLLVLNFWAGVYLGHHGGQLRGRIVLTLGLAGNLGVLGYYKYASFFVNTLNAATGAGWAAANVILPLGISFFIFQKLAYLVDAYHGKTRGYNFIDYCLFVTFFPQLIAGPIVHHSEVVPQFTRRKDYRLNAGDLSVGMTQLVMGLFKKVVIADRMALYATPIFEAARTGGAPTFLDGWIAALAYTFQLYFDFSGYSDMALGLGRMFGIKLPLNFNSPYKAVNIVDFWRRWHMTLSRFLRDYLYIPLGGGRKGPARRYVNLMLVMLLGGLWHGAGWTFVFWGGLHGAYLTLNHAWMAWRRGRGAAKPQPTRLGQWAGRSMTFVLVVIAWVFFRSADFAAAGRMLGAMFGGQGISSISSYDTGTAFAWLGVLLAAVWLLPNTQEILADYTPALEYETQRAAGGGNAKPENTLPSWARWRPASPWAIAVSIVAVFTITQMSRISEFIYWQF